MTKEERHIAVLNRLIESMDVFDSVQPTEERKKAIKAAIQALENIGHLTDRPCSVCELRKENGCCKWDCVFKGV